MTTYKVVVTFITDSEEEAMKVKEQVERDIIHGYSQPIWLLEVNVTPTQG